MRKLLSALVVVIAFVGASESATYRQKIAWMKGTPTDTASVTLVERINECVKEQCASMLRGQITKDQFTNSTQFTDAQLIEFCLRGINGAMSERLLPSYMAAALINTNGVNSTDANLDQVFLNITWSICKLIGNGSL